MSRAAILAGLAFAASAAAPAHAGEGAVGDARWLTPNADIVRFLTTAPGECVAPAKDREAAYIQEVGRAAFRSPLLLGGPAARAGLSCNTCHPDGRRNADFYLEGLSGAPGEADVTSALFSAVREDGIANSRPIPDLVGERAKSSFGSSGAFHSLDAFIDSAVHDEFQGRPPKPVVDALAAYVASFDPAYCPDAPRRVTERADIADTRRALAAARTALAKGDEATADFLIVAAQQELKRVNERFSGADAAEERSMIETLSRKIGGARAIAPGSPLGADARLEEAELDAKRLGWRLRAEREASLYDAKVIADRLGVRN